MKRDEKQNTTVGEAHRPETAVREQSPQDQLATFARDILRLCGEARRLTSDAIDRDREAGEVCLKAKAACEEAEVPWEPWCEEHLDTIGGLRTVQRLMRVAKNWKRIERERKKTPDLTTTAALRLLANARRKGRERAAGAAPEPQGPEPEQQPAGQTTDQMPRLRVSRSRAEKVATAMGLDPRVALDYLGLMFGTAGFIMDVVDG
jgi:hypothetical protein